MTSSTERDTPITRLGLVVFGVISLIAGFFMLRAGIAAFGEVREALAWPTVQGVIVGSTVREIKRPGVVTYEAAIDYRFVVADVEYHGSRVGIAQGMSSEKKGKMEALVARFPVQREVTVSYNPKNPVDSLLEPAAQLRHYGMIALGVGIMLVGGFVIYITVIARVRPLEIQVTAAAGAWFADLLQTEAIPGDACIKLAAQPASIDSVGIEMFFVSPDRANLQFRTRVGTLTFVADNASGPRLRGVTLDINDEGKIQFVAPS